MKNKNKANKNRKGAMGESWGNAGGGIVVEASSRKSWRKQQRLARKKRQHQALSKPRARQEEEPTSSAHSSDNCAESKKKKLYDGLEGMGRSRPHCIPKRVRFSASVEENMTTLMKSAIPTGPRELSREPSKKSLEERSNPSHAAIRCGYDHLDNETAAAFHRDDREINYLELNLGIKTSIKRGNAGKRQVSCDLNKEFSENEGYGDDFGDFLMGLDDLVDRCSGSAGDGDTNDFSGSDRCDYRISGEECGNYDGIEENQTVFTKEDGSPHCAAAQENPYERLDEETALAFRKDDAEIAELEQKLGLSFSDSPRKAKKKLVKEFASTFQGYGEDFLEFLDGLDSLGERAGMLDIQRTDEPFRKEGVSLEGDAATDSDDDIEKSKVLSRGDLTKDTSDMEEGTRTDLSDHDIALTYKPIYGEDIYGNKIDALNDAAELTKYIPPHLRKKSNGEAASDSVGNKGISLPPSGVAPVGDPDTFKPILRLLNSSLNRLSDQTLESVSKSIASIYSQYPFHDVNECLWKNVQMACVSPHMIMSGLIPLYLGALAGVHWLRGDEIQLAGRLLEWSVMNFFDSLEKGRQSGSLRDNSPDLEEQHKMVNKESTNLLMIVCYLYNYGVVHCSLVYDLVRNFLENFAEIDVESLLIVLNHCGQQLRLDDPSSLKDIVLLVNDRAKAIMIGNAKRVNLPRVQYMVDVITELKNNKPRKKDVSLREKTNALKKCIGRLKSLASQSLAGKKSGSCLRVTLRDILDAETKGRWWMVGASWAGNQQSKLLWKDDTEDGTSSRKTGNNRVDGKTSKKKSKNEGEEGLLALASLQRMNTDARRSIFCIIMASSDRDDAFEKLVRRGLLKPKAERDVIRVIIHCCGEEQSYNPFYAHLTMRVCEYQAKSWFTLMLAYWDTFKQLESYSLRKCANLAKLLADLIGGAEKETLVNEGVKHEKQCRLNIGVLKRINFSASDMPEMAVVFLSVFLTFLFESWDDFVIQKVFKYGAEAGTAGKFPPKNRQPVESDSDSGDCDGVDTAQKSKKEVSNELSENLSVFLLQYVKPSPKNVDGSRFHSNYLSALKSCEETNAFLNHKY